MGLLSWDLEVNGADKAEAAIEAVDKSAREAADGMKAADKASDQLGQGLDGAAAAAKEADAAFDGAAASAREAARASDDAGDGVGGLNDRVREGLTGFDEFGGRIGQISNALNVLSGVAIVGMVTGFRDAVTAMYEATEAGQAAKVASEAQAGAISSVVDWLKEQKEITEQTTAATWAKINADRAQAISADELNKVITRQYDAQREYAEALRELGILREQFGERGEALGVSGFGKAPEELRRMQRLQATVKELGAELIELDKVREAEQARLIAINNEVNKAATALDKSGTTFDEHTASVQAHADALRSDAEAAAELLDFVEELDVEAAMAGIFDPDAFPDPEAILGDLAAYAEAQADAVLDQFRRISGAAEDKADRIDRAAAQEAAAYAASTAAALGAAASLAEALGASSAIVSAIKIAENVAAATEAGAKALVAGAEGNIPSAIAYGAGAVEHVAAAIDWGADALGGGGGSTPSTSTPTPPTSSPRDTVEAGDRSRNQPMTGALTVQFMNAQPLATKAEIQDAILQAQNEAGRRRDRTRVDYDRTATRRGRR
jgi:hypothetical protein